MADEFQATAAICGGGGGTWWNSPRSVMSPSDHFLSITSDDFGFQENNIKSLMTCMDKNIGFGQREADSDSGGSNVTVDSTLEMLGLGFSSNSWNQTILQEDLNSNFISSQYQDQGFLSTTASPYLLDPTCSTSSSTSSSSNLLHTFYEPEPNPYNFISTPNYSINDQAAYGLINNFSNNSNSQPIWSSSSDSNLNNITPNSFLTSPQITATCPDDKPKNLKTRSQSETLKKGKDIESAAKKQRVATPSSLPTFKVRKENLRDQITSLQQLVSPFGKTDTASVLQEAIEYIKFLHDQVNVLSTPYMKQDVSIQQQQQQQQNEEGNENQELRGHGLCLVPISSTFPVANETTADFWTPTFGGNNFR